MVLAELQQVASGLGIRGTARMRKSQLIEVIKEAQAGGAPAQAADTAAEAKPKRRATSKARTGDEATAAETKAEKAVAQQQIEIPGQPAGGPSRASEAERDDAPAVERRRRRAVAEAGSPETVAVEAKSEPKADTAGEAKGDRRRRRRPPGPP